MWDYPAALGCAGGPADASAQYSPAIVDPPEGSDVIDEWRFYYGLAQRMGLQLSIGGQMFTTITPQPLDMVVPPTADEVLEMVCQGSRVPLAEVKRHPRGAEFPEPAVVVAEKDPGWTGRLELGNADMMSDLAAYGARQPGDVAADVPTTGQLRMICRRMTHVRNSSCNDLATNKGRSYNPAFMHSEDLARLGLQPGDVVRISSARSEILGIADVDDTLRPGLLSMAHSFGAGPERDDEFREIGSNTSRLLFDDRDVERYTGQPVMSNILVDVTRVAEPAPVPA
jgi:anaerobic selenocysteine-containing dehydrogenase